MNIKQTTMPVSKVVHVHLLNRARHERKDYYFTSIAAIFTTLTTEDVGCNLQYLQHALSHGPVANSCALIKQSELIGIKRNGTK